MTGRLAGRTPIVTGASRGLGRSIALALAAEGAAVAVAARTEQVWNDKLPGTIGETVAEIEAAGGRAVAIRADLTNRDDLPRLVDEARDALGPITVLVNNAAFTAPGRPPAPGAPTPQKKSVRHQSRRAASGLAAVRRNTRARLSAALRNRGVRGLRADAVGGAGHDRRRPRGDRQHQLGRLPHPRDGPLPRLLRRRAARLRRLTKAALEHLTESAAYELQRRNIAVNALSPSEAMMTPGLSYYRMDFAQVGSEADFAESVVRLALVDPSAVTGRTIGHHEVLDGTFTPFGGVHR
jgi:7-alpha-hydroxysteroid dehydrogenase